MNALVLGGGAARGFAHLGVWKNLEKNNVKIDIITGTSMGALVGAFIADKKSFDEMMDIMEGINWFQLMSFPKKGVLMSGDTITKWLEDKFGDRCIEDLDIPFACIATDIDSGEEVVFDSGKIVDALRASISVPAVLKPHKVNNHFCVDGGLVNNLPVLQAEKMGATRVLAIKVQKPKGRVTAYRNFCETRSWWKRRFRFWGAKLFHDMIEKTIELLSIAGDNYQIQQASISVDVICFDNEKFAYMDFFKWKDIVKVSSGVSLPQGWD